MSGGGSTSVKPEHRPELGGAPEVGGIDLERDVVEHDLQDTLRAAAQKSSETSAAATTIAVDQVTASAVISMSRP